MTIEERVARLEANVKQQETDMLELIRGVTKLANILRNLVVKKNKTFVSWLFGRGK